MNKAIGVFEIQSELTVRIFGVVAINKLWASEIMESAQDLYSKGISSLTIASSYSEENRIQAMQFTSLSDAFKQGVNYAMGKEVFEDLIQDEESFMCSKDFEFFSNGVAFYSSTYIRDGLILNKVGYAEVFNKELVSWNDFELDLITEYEEVEELLNVLDIIKNLNASQSQREVLNLLSSNIEEHLLLNE